jgi:hypothetical protein
VLGDKRAAAHGVLTLRSAEQGRERVAAGWELLSSRRACASCLTRTSRKARTPRTRNPIRGIRRGRIGICRRTPNSAAAATAIAAIRAGGARVADSNGDVPQ